MLKIRLKRLGRKRVPFYRVVVAHATSRRDGAPVAELGFYNPISKQLRLDKAAAENWILKGAQPTETAAWLIKQAAENPTEVITLSLVKADVLSKKAQAKAKAEADAKVAEAAKVAAEAAAAAEAAKAAAETPEEAPAAETVA
jgi:small subunit ribosomal protein S16